MTISTIGLDLGKSVFQVHGVDAHGKVVVTKQLRRGAVLRFFANLPPCLVGLEACATAHHWARAIGNLGHEVRLMPPSTSSPTSSAARTIAPMPRRSARRCSAPPCASSRSRARSSRACWSSIAFARHWWPAHAADQRDARPSGRVWARCAAGAGNVRELIRRLADAEEVPAMARGVLQTLIDQLRHTEARITDLDAQLAEQARRDETAKRLMTSPASGRSSRPRWSPRSATPEPSVPDATWRPGSAWSRASARPAARNGWSGITKAGDGYLRRLLVNGARALTRWWRTRSPWLAGAAGAPARERRRGGARQQAGAHRLGGDGPRRGLSRRRIARGRRESSSRHMVPSGCEGNRRGDGSTGRTGIGGNPNDAWDIEVRSRDRVPIRGSHQGPQPLRCTRGRIDGSNRLVCRIGAESPCRAGAVHRWVIVPALPGLSGRPGWVRSSAWIWDFSSTESTSAWRGRIDVEADDVRELGGELGVARALEGADAVRLQPVRRPDPLHRAQGQMPIALAIARPVQCVASPGGSAQVSATTRRTVGVGQRRLAGLAGLVAQQPVDAGLDEALLPAPDRRPADPARRATSATLQPLGRVQDDPRPRDVLLRRGCDRPRSPPNAHDPRPRPGDRPSEPCPSHSTARENHES